MEGSFAQAANKHHFKRARWRRLWRQQIQDWLIAAVQNIALLCGLTGSAVPAKRPKTPNKRGGNACFFILLATRDLCAIERFPGRCRSAATPLAAVA